MKIKKFLRHFAFIVIIAIACIVPLPFPIISNRKDEQPKYIFEQVEIREEDDEEDTLKGLF